MVSSFFLVFAVTGRKFFGNNEGFDHNNPGDYSYTLYFTDNYNFYFITSC